MSAAIAYRPDIDGLRAIAVLSILFFHFFEIGGGFAGVDIFFVLSGYLITRIIAGDMTAGSFTLSGFYMRRIKRIFPAFFVCTAVTLGVGYFLFSPDDYAALGQSAMYGAGFLPNLFFFNHTGYFDGAASLMPLLHTWSLGVEEQFYIVWPLLLGLYLWSVKRRGWKPSLAILVTFVVLSFAINIYWTADFPKKAFFMPFSRFWEFCIGAGVALFGHLLPRRRFAGDVMALTGLAMIVYVFAIPPLPRDFPGYAALLPTIGTALVILGRGSTLVAKTLALAPMRFTGKISYSLYLWHWPLIVYWKYYTTETAISVSDAAWMTVLCFALAYASWRYVEQPLRKHGAGKLKTIVLGLGVAVLFGIAGWGIYAAKGFPERFPASLHFTKKAMWDWQCPQKVSFGSRCAVGAPWDATKQKGIIWGDSHAEHLLPVLDAAAKDKKLSIALYRGCLPVIDKDRLRFDNAGAPNFVEDCNNSRLNTIRFIKENKDIRFVLLSARWSYYTAYIYDGEGGKKSRENGLKLMEEGLRRLARDIARPGLEIIIMADVPNFGFDPALCALNELQTVFHKSCERNRAFIAHEGREARQNPTHDMLRTLADRKTRTTVFVPADHMCGPQGCALKIDNELIYRDSHHIRRNLTPEITGKLIERMQLDRLIDDLASSPR